MSLRQQPSSNRDLVRAMQRTADAVRDPSRTFYDLIAESAATHADQLVNRADQALYQSKARGRDRISVSEKPSGTAPPVPPVKAA